MTPSPAAASPSAPPLALGPHVLIVDDEPQIREILAAVLAREGYRVTSRASAREALVDLGSRDACVELLVTDLKMPDMSGLELIREAKRLSPSIGSVLITAFASMETALAALRHGADDYLMKPFGLDDVRRVVDRVLTERRLAGDGRRAVSAVQDENDALRRERRVTEAALHDAKRDLRLSRRDLERRLRDLEFVAELSGLLAGEDLDRILRTTARITARRFHAHVTHIEVDTGDECLEADHREGDEPIALPAPLGALLLERARSDPTGASRDDILGQGRPLEGMAAVVPSSGTPGGIVVLRPVLPHRDAGDLALLAMIARSLKPAVEAERLRRRAETAGLDVARGILEAMEGRGPLRRGHAERVMQLASRAAQRLGLSAGERRSLETAARLHDIGEIGIPEEFFSRAGPLTPGEVEVVRSHAVMGARLLEPLGDAAAYVRHHHERPDGLGYPDGLKEDEIPIGAGVIGVAEAYDAMTHARPYHATVTPAEARREVLRLRGTQFLPRAVDAVLEALPA